LSSQAPTTDEPQALCIVRDMTTSSTATSKALLSVAASTTASKLMQLVGRHFSYSPDSFELLLQSHHQGEAVAIHVCEDQTIEELGFCVDKVSRNMLVIYDRNREPPKKLMLTLKKKELPDKRCPAAAYLRSRQVNCKRKDLSISLFSPGYVGLVNQAMTCYLNSLLQTLYMTPEFRNALYRWEFDGSEQDAAKSIPFQLQKLFLLLQTSSRPAIGTTELTTSFGWDSSEAWQQHDVQELCRVMFDALEHKFKKTNQANLICQLYEGKLKDYVQCLECGSESAREDTFLDVPLVVRPFGSSQAYGSVEEALRAFVTPETLEGSNQYSCDKCGKKCDAHKGLKFVRFPYLLTLQLKRFDFDPVTMHRIKLNDKVTFPEILDLNQFVRLDCTSENVCDDTDTTDSGSALDEEVPANSVATTGARPTNGPCEDTGSDDEGIDMGGMETAAANSRNLNRSPPLGPYVYELFSIMVHSGSANGGHYYAYVKSFTENQWFCFNDAQVSRVSYEEIRKTYGGGPSRSGYYISAYSSSTNAYMLMYRKVDKESNAEPMSPEEFPEHLKALLKSMQEAEERERQQKELERSMVKIKLFCLIPGRLTMQEMRLKVHKDSSLAEATQTAHQIMGLEGVVPLERCRLVMYDDCSESLECSLEDQEDQTIGEILGGVKSTYHCDLLLEIRGPHETFQPYKKGGKREQIGRRTPACPSVSWSHTMRGSKYKTVRAFGARKRSMKLVRMAKLEVSARRAVNDDRVNTSSDGFSVPSAVHLKKTFREPEALCVEKFYAESAVAVKTACKKMDPGFCKDITVVYDGTWHKRGHTSHIGVGSVIEYHTGLILDAVVLSNLCLGCQTGPKPGDQGYDSWHMHHVCQKNTDAKSGRMEVEAALTLFKRSISKHDLRYTALVSDGDSRTFSALTEENVYGLVPIVKEECLNHVQKRMGTALRNLVQKSDKPLSGKGRLTKALIDKLTDYYGWALRNNSKDVAAMQRAVMATYHHVTSTDQEPHHELCPEEAQSWCRHRVAEAKVALIRKVGCCRDCSKFYLEHRETRNFAYLEYLEHCETRNFAYLEFFHSFYDFELMRYYCNVVDVLLVRILPFALISKASWSSLDILSGELDGNSAPLSGRCRLRKKTSGNPGPVYLDSAKFDDEVPTFLSYEVFLEVLPGPERVVSSSSLVVFVRRWRPSSFTFDPLDEVVLEERTVDALKDALSSLSGLPPDNIEVAKCPGPFPCVVSSLTVHAEMEWHSSASSLSSWPLYISEDGLVVLYRDKTEPLKELTEEEKREISNRENVRAHKSLQTTTSVRKERALKIYTGSPPSNASGALSDAKPSLHSVPIDLD
ncbi:unnamed protein product, partial [Ixodes persulcatus]